MYTRYERDPATPVNRSCRQVPFPSDPGAGVPALRVAGLRAAAGRFAAVRVAGRPIDLRGAGRPVAALTIFGAALAEARIALAGNAVTEVGRRGRLRRTGPGRNALITADGSPDFCLRGTTGGLRFMGEKALEVRSPR